MHESISAPVVGAGNTVHTPVKSSAHPVLLLPISKMSAPLLHLSVSGV